MIIAAGDYAGRPELTGFNDEVRSVLSEGSGEANSAC